MRATSSAAAAMAEGNSALAGPILVLGSVADWWAEINESAKWQDGVFFFLTAAYALVSAVALVFTLTLLDLPGLLFFSTYTLLVLFWAEIYHQASPTTTSSHIFIWCFNILTFFKDYWQARSLPTDKLRAAYIAVNSLVYAIQIGIWIYLWIDDNSIVELVGKIFIAVVSFIACLGFLIYGGRLFFLLRRFPIESKGRRKKLHEVGSVTAICFTCFLIRLVVVALSAFDLDLSLEVMDHPILDLIYYMLTEILPSALVLYILRKLPPKRVSAQYHPIR
ncbi:Tobamovirus multiplication protein 1 [Ananas comosus]|uniref:Tobamovirus multiplication protein 1 n=1 Tax=Ananas comosus TaxID=4615 RepID=A0A199VUX1_ANACO|nr:Tobamovirus multiplication protein 1 [Ananas comosus]